MSDSFEKEDVWDEESLREEERDARKKFWKAWRRVRFSHKRENNNTSAQGAG